MHRALYFAVMINIKPIKSQFMTYYGRLNCARCTHTLHILSNCYPTLLPFLSNNNSFKRFNTNLIDSMQLEISFHNEQPTPTLSISLLYSLCYFNVNFNWFESFWNWIGKQLINFNDKVSVGCINKAIVSFAFFPATRMQAILKTKIQSIFSSFILRTAHISILWRIFQWYQNYNRWAQTFRSFLCDCSRFRTRDFCNGIVLLERFAQKPSEWETRSQENEKKV